jgi:tRNA 2-thiouridine synthesizing protein A
MDTLNVRGLSCPIPVLKTKKALEKGCQELQITGNSSVSRENVSKFALSQGFKVAVLNENPDEWNIVITK